MLQVACGTSIRGRSAERVRRWTADKEKISPLLFTCTSDCGNLINFGDTSSRSKMAIWPLQRAGLMPHECRIVTGAEMLLSHMPALRRKKAIFFVLCPLVCFFPSNSGWSWHRINEDCDCDWDKNFTDTPFVHVHVLLSMKQKLQL